MVHEPGHGLHHLWRTHAMPYAIFYDGNVAIHYSDDFAQVGYEGGSHGCSQLRDYQAAKWLFEQVKRGDKVVVY